jgi:hypothetical protein
MRAIRVVLARESADGPTVEAVGGLSLAGVGNLY